eukprot:TRINITY_DN2351_c0_g1_i6.p1 TRINITY_DN2351_c0_g1~~TRINITY_DN2351_c0_g1_i6.p1  ORF type:complete len:640 (-),score=172.28 TRINITY_DN2351_c0_g1_i6:54-1973(-)
MANTRVADNSTIPNVANQGSFFNRDNFHKMELIFERVNISASVTVEAKIPDSNRVTKVKQDKIILNDLKGSLRAGKFTAIMGPSGCGKTTLLNFLSGRIDQSNLKIEGSLRLNGKYITDIEKYNHLIAYVMQDDILMATFSVREALMFAANLRLKTSPAERAEKVNLLLQDLHLVKCADTKIGNVMIRGVSGGERKRTSIGVELITNPSMIFLDEPTTGLDSETALRVIELLKSLAEAGRTVISTIHQPSSEIFREFDQLLLMVRGNIIYQGAANQAVGYLRSIDFDCPRFCNPADYFMRIMNEDDILLVAETNGEELSSDQVKTRFEERITKFVTSYRNDSSDVAVPQENEELAQGRQWQTPFITQFALVFYRSWVNQFRNPMEMFMKTFQSIFMALLTYLVFNDLGTDFSGIQNRKGVLFFLVTGFCFGSIQGALGTFSSERPLFLRERLNKQYTVGAYFWGKSLSELLFHIIWPWLQATIVFFGCGLNNNGDWKYWIAVLISITTFFTGTAYGLLISVVIPKMEVAMSLVPVLLIPLMAFAGFFVNQNKIPFYFKPFEYISPWKYGFQALCYNEFEDNTALDCIKNKTCDPLKDLDFHQGMWLSIAIQASLGLGFRIISYIPVSYTHLTLPTIYSV